LNKLNKRNPIAKAIKVALLATAAVSALSTPAVFAADEEDEVSDEQEIVVTGSRIKKKELSNPAPVVVIGREEIKRFGTSDLGTILGEFSSITASDTLQGNAQNNQQAGVSSANLRSLGANRTLVLVDGKRHVASTQGTAQVDLTTIPTNLIERVEIITGGASAIYGSDAVTGVVNVILRKDYEGFELNLLGSDSTESVGNSNSDINFLAGTNFSEGKGNITFFAGRDYTSEVLSADIQQLNNFGTVENPLDTGENDGIPDRLTVPFVGSEFISSTGVLNPFGGGTRYTFLNDGTPVIQQDRVLSNSFAFGNFPNGCDTCFFTERTENFLPQAEKFNFGGTLNYEVSDNVTLYSDFKYIRSDIEQQFQPGFNFGGITINVVDNPYLDAGLRQTLLDAGQTSVTMAKFFDEIGNRSADNRRETARFVAGAKGTFDLGETPLDFDLSYVNGRTSNQRGTLNSTIPNNLTAALDAVIDPLTGEAACRSQVPSAQGTGYEDPADLRGDTCAPYNPFGFGAASQEAIDFVSADVLRQDEITQEIISGSLAFDSADWFELPGGPMGVALGFETREETSETVTDSLTRSGILANAATPNESGGYDVDEGFIELSLPLLADMSFAKELTMDLAYRSADYSHAGSAEAYKVGLVYAPVDDIRLRATYGESVRAPDISEAFSPQSPGFGRVSDPCDADNLGNDPDRAANCAALGIPAGFEANDNVSINVISGGNPNLTPEESESTTIGIVWTPSFIEDFSLTLDSYSIDIADAILFVPTQAIADNCVDSSSGLDANFCGAVDRDPVTHDITLVRSGFINGSALEVAGLEMDIRYATDLSFIDFPGELSMHLAATRLSKLDRFEFQNIPEDVDRDDGEIGDPTLQGRFVMNYSLDDLNINWTSRFVERSARFNLTGGDDTSIAEDINPAYHGSVTTHDLSASYQITQDISVFGGVRNLSNKLPDGYTRNEIYDPYGRRVFAGASFNF